MATSRSSGLCKLRRKARLVRAKTVSRTRPLSKVLTAHLETPLLQLCTATGKIRRPHSPLSAGDTLKSTDRSSNPDSGSRTIDQETQPCTPSPRSYPLNVAFEFEGKSQHGLDLTLTRADPADSSHAEGLQRSEDSHSTSEGEMSNSYGSDAHLQPTRVKLMEPPSKSASATTSALVLEMRKGHAVGSTSHYSDTELQHQALNSGLKACTLCGTTKTPMWRSGPQGPKSLCNACGIRFKKYSSSQGQIEPLYYAIPPSAHHDSPKSLARPLKRKHNPVLLTGEPPRPQKMCSKSLVPGIALRQEKKNKWLQVVVARKEQGEFKEGKINSSIVWNTPAAPASFKKIYGCFPFHSKFKKLAPINKHHSLNNVFAKDEEEATVLLMHLSCGLVY